MLQNEAPVYIIDRRVAPSTFAALGGPRTSGVSFAGILAVPFAKNTELHGETRSGDTELRVLADLRICHQFVCMSLYLDSILYSSNMEIAGTRCVPPDKN